MVDELVLSQKDQLQSHRLIHQVAQVSKVRNVKREFLERITLKLTSASWCRAIIFFHADLRSVLRDAF